MSTAIRPYYVSLNSGLETPCETLGLNPMTLSRESLGVDVLMLEQSRVRGAWATELAHDVTVRFYRLKEDDTLEQLFMGRVVSPQASESASAVRRIIRVCNVMQLARECLFQRGDWLPTIIPDESPDTDPDEQGDICSLYYGANYETYIGSSLRKRIQRQRVDQAVQEAAIGLQRLTALQGQPMVWRPVLQSCYLGPLANVPRPEPSMEESGNWLDWFVKVLRPVPDAFMSWDYAGSRPYMRVGKFALQNPVAVADGWPTLRRDLRRDRDREGTSLRVVSPLADNPDNAQPLRGYIRRDTEATWPTSGAAGVMLRGARVISMAYGDFLGNADAAKAAAFLGPSLLEAQTEGTVELMGAAWRWCAPGSVLTSGGLRYNVQTTLLNLATESLTATLGMPRQLGVQDLEEMLKRAKVRR